MTLTFSTSADPQYLDINVYVDHDLLTNNDPAGQSKVLKTSLETFNFNRYLRVGGLELNTEVALGQEVPKVQFHNVATYASALSEEEIAHNYHAWLPKGTLEGESFYVCVDEDCTLATCPGVPLLNPNGFRNAGTRNNPFFDAATTHNRQILVDFRGTFESAFGTLYDCLGKPVLASGLVLELAGCPETSQLLTFVPNPDFFSGSDPMCKAPPFTSAVSFSYNYRIPEGDNALENGEEYTVTIDVQPKNDQPVARPGSVTLKFAAEAVVAFEAEDVDVGDSVAAVALLNLPSFGDLYYFTRPSDGGGGGGGGGTIVRGAKLTAADVSSSASSPQPLAALELLYVSTSEDVARSGLATAATEAIRFQVKDTGVPASESMWSAPGVFTLTVNSTLVACGAVADGVAEAEGCAYTIDAGKEDGFNAPNDQGCIRLDLTGRDTSVLARPLEYVLRALPTNGVLYQYDPLLTNVQSTHVGGCTETVISAVGTRVTGRDSAGAAVLGFKPRANYFNSIEVEVDDNNPTTDGTCEIQLFAGKAYDTIAFVVQPQDIDFASATGTQSIAIVSVNDMPSVSSDTEGEVAATAGIG